MTRTLLIIVAIILIFFLAFSYINDVMIWQLFFNQLVQLFFSTRFSKLFLSILFDNSEHKLQKIVAIFLAS